MKTSRIISSVLAGVMVASTLAVGAVSASAATLKAPKTVTVKNAKSGITIKWSAVKGAKKYKVYRGSKLVKTTKNAKTRTYTDKKAKAGTTYTYKVKAVAGKTTGKASKGVKITRLKATTIKSVTTNASSLKVAWKKVTGATKYYVYRKAEGAKSYSKVKTVKTTSYTDAKVTSGLTYAYKIKAYAAKGKSLSVASAAKSKNFVKKVANVAVAVADAKATVTWTADAGAKTYTVYRQAIGEDAYTAVATVSEAKYEDAYTGANPTAYKYYVVAKDTANSVKSAVVTAQYIPAGSYQTVDGNLNVNLKLAKGDTYEAGQALVDELKLTAADYTVAVEEGTDVVALDGNTITATQEGTAKIKVTLTESVAKAIREAIGGNYANTLATGVVYVNVTVA